MPLLFNTLNLSTYADLLETVRYDGDFPFTLDLDDLERINQVVARIAHVRTHYTMFLFCQACQSEVPQISHLWHIVTELEALGVKGFIRSIEERRMYGNYESMKRAWELSCEEVKELRVRQRGLQDEVHELQGRLENAFTRSASPGTTWNRFCDVRLNSAESEVGKSDYEGHVNKKVGDVQLQTNCERPVRKQRPTPDSLIVAEASRSSRHTAPSGGVTVIKRSDVPNPEYPPPLPLSTKEEDDERWNIAQYSKAEDDLCDKEPNEYEDSYSRNPKSHCTLVQALSYIYIPLPENFTVLSYNDCFPPTTFPSQSTVFYFPNGASKNQLLSILRQRALAGMQIPYLDAVDNIDVTMVCINDMGHELKNSILKVMTQEGWGAEAGNQWLVEGQGDAYIISHSKPNNSTDATIDLDKNRKGRCDQPQLRGGASLGSQREDTAGEYDVPDSTMAYGNHLNNNIERLGNICLDDELCLEHAGIKYIRILQLQNSSHNRTIERLLEVINGLEGTVEWKNDQIDNVFRHLGEWESDVKLAEDEADLTKREAGQLTELIKMVDKKFNDKEQWRINKNYGILSETGPIPWGGPKTPKIRGGGNNHGSPQASSTHNASELESGLSTHDIQAAAFYFFPSVSIIVLLTNPPHYFQWPCRTTLSQIRDSLQQRHIQGIENNHHLHHIRKVFEIREEMNIPLPDTREGKQVMITIPQVEDEFEHGRNESALWESTFGPDEYERATSENIKNLEIPIVNDRAHFSPPNSGEDEFCFARDVIDIINNHVPASKESPNYDCSYTSENSQNLLSLAGLPSPHNFPTAINCICSTSRAFSSPPFSMPSSSFFPAVPTTRPSFLREHTESLAPESRSYLRPASMSEDKQPNVSRHSPNEKYDDYAKSKLSRSASFDHEINSSVEDRKNDDWEIWRHKKGGSCESWLNEKSLEPERSNCTFCQLPFAENL